VNSDRSPSFLGAEHAAKIDGVNLRLQATAINSDMLGPKCEDWHRHPYFEVYWINGGSAEYLTDCEIYPVGAGTLIFVSIGQMHNWRFSTDISGYKVGFSPHEISESALHLVDDGDLPFFFAPSAPSIISVPRRKWSDFDARFGTLARELESNEPLRLEAARALLHLLLIGCQRVALLNARMTVSESPAAQLARRFWWEVNRGFLTLRHVRDYAARLHVTANHLVETVREQFGRTPGRLIDERLYLEATRLLLHTTRSVSEIAYFLEFKNPSHFGAFFKRHAGCSPGEARRRFWQRVSRPRPNRSLARSIKENREVVQANIMQA